MQPRTLALVVAIPAFLAPLASAQPFQTFTPPPPPPVSSTPPAASDARYPLVFDKTTFDLGEHLDTDQFVSHEFKFVNKSDRVFSPTHKGGCGRVYYFDKSTYAPGDTGTLILGTHVGNRNGPSSLTVTLLDPDNAKSTQVVRINIDVIPTVQIAWSHKGLLEIAEGHEAVMRLTVTGLGSDFTASIVDAPPDHVQIETGTPVATQVRGRAARRVEFTFKVGADAPRGWLFPQPPKLRLGNPASSEQRVFVDACVIPLITATPLVRRLYRCGEAITETTSILQARDGLPFMPTLIEAQPQMGAAPLIDWSPTFVDGKFAIRLQLRSPIETTEKWVIGNILVHAPGLRLPLAVPYRLSPAPTTTLTQSN